MRKVLETFGKKGKRAYVRVIRETVGRRELVRVLWNEPGAGRKLESFDDTRRGIAEAKAYALGKHEALLDHTKPAPDAATIETGLTLRQLRERYFTAHANAWEPATVRNKAARWKVLELMLGRDFPVAQLTCERLDEVVAAMLASDVKRVHKKRSANQVKMTIAVLTAAYRWAVDDRGILAPSRVVTFRPKLKQALKKQVVKMDEYSAEERAAIAANLNPRHPTEWRAWALNVIFAYCGPRQNAARHLKWSDIELGADYTTGSITWRAETDKMDNERVQPMPAPVVEAFWIALSWREYDGYTGPYVFYGVQRRTRGQAFARQSHRAKHKESLEGVTVNEKPYTYSALNAALRRAEDRAGIEHVAYRATHGHRRGVSGDIHEATGSSKKAADWIGDKSTKVVEKHYLLTRQENLDEAAAIVTASVGTATPAVTSGGKSAIKRNSPAKRGEAGSKNDA